MTSLPPLLLAGQFPPPVNGFAYITQEMAKALAASHEVTIIDLAPHKPNDGLPYHLRRLGLTLRGLWPLLRGCLKPRRVFYVACEGGLGLVYTLILCAAARALRTPTFIHHHSFHYIDRRSSLMALLLLVCGKGATHIFLCPIMGERFAARYAASVKSVVLSNSAFVAPVASPPRTQQAGAPLVIGLLSNLNNEKGLGLFLDLLRRAAQEGLNIAGVLAGPAPSEADQQAIAAAQRDLGKRLDYRGAVYGAAKDAFFGSIDVFVFPTLYANEAQPTVVFEAQAHGIPTLSFNRGCIPCQVGACGLIVPQGEDFVAAALAWLKVQLDAPGALAQLKLDARAAFMNDREAALRTVATLMQPTTNGKSK